MLKKNPAGCGQSVCSLLQRFLDFSFLALDCPDFYQLLPDLHLGSQPYGLAERLPRGLLVELVEKWEDVAEIVGLDVGDVYFPIKGRPSS